jgi:hypothetical protein
VRWQLTYDSLTEAFESGRATQLDAHKQEKYVMKTDDVL